MSPQAEKVLTELRNCTVTGGTTRTIGEAVNASPDAVRRCLGELKRSGYVITNMPGSRLVRLFE